MTNSFLLSTRVSLYGLSISPSLGALGICRPLHYDDIDFSLASVTRTNNLRKIKKMPSRLSDRTKEIRPVVVKYCFLNNIILKILCMNYKGDQTVTQFTRLSNVHSMTPYFCATGCMTAKYLRIHTNIPRYSRRRAR